MTAAHTWVEAWRRGRRSAIFEELKTVSKARATWLAAAIAYELGDDGHDFVAWLDERAVSL